MKTNIRYSILYALLPAFFMLLLTEGCKKAADPADPAQPDSEFYLKGSVVNGSTHQGIANAKVYFGGQTVLTTDANGFYKVNCKTTGSGTYNVRVTADGYGYGFASASISHSAAMVNTIMLKPLAEPVTIGSAGGTVAMADQESFFPGSQTTVTIPEGSFSGNTSVSATRFMGMDVPGYAPANLLNLCTVNLSPAATVTNKAVELRFALPYSNPSVQTLPLMRYNFESDVWENTGIVANVAQATNFAIAEIYKFGTYSLAITGSFSPKAGNKGAATTLQLDPTRSSVDFTYLAKNTYPGATPATISMAYLTNLASQNTRVSFSDSTLFTFNYIGSKPDSLAPVKSTMSGFYRWVPKVSYATQDMQTTTTIYGVSTSGIIEHQVYSPASGYLFIHDQGGGGK